MPVMKRWNVAAILGCVFACALFAGCGEIDPSGDGAFTLTAQRNAVGSFEYGVYDTVSGLAIAPTSGTVYAICESGGARCVVPYSASALESGTQLDLASIDPDLEPYEIWVEGAELHVLCGGSYNSTFWNDVVCDAETGLATGRVYDATFLVNATLSSFTTMRVVGGTGGVYFVDPLYKRIGFSARDTIGYAEPSGLFLDIERIKSYLPHRDRELAPILGDIAWDGADRLAVSVFYEGDSPEGGCVLILDAATFDLVDYIGGSWLIHGACGLDYDDDGRLVVADSWAGSVKVFDGRALLDWSSGEDASGGVEQGVIDEPTRLRVLGNSILVLDDDGDGDRTSSILKYTYAP